MSGKKSHKKFKFGEVIVCKYVEIFWDKTEKIIFDLNVILNLCSGWVWIQHRSCNAVLKLQLVTLIQKSATVLDKLLLSQTIFSYIITNLLLVSFCEKFSALLFSSTIDKLEFSIGFSVSFQESMPSINFTKHKIGESKSTVNAFLRFLQRIVKIKKVYCSGF